MLALALCLLSLAESAPMLTREPEEFWIWDEQNEIYINMAEGSTETMDKEFNPIDDEDEEA